ncbi:hypothetical protein ACQPXS_46990 (plasmid) [Streptomyces sp. CA-142005]|uniref:hypothetical protein n=1 Tax=Streptomyces sp. CA-142005 TaxID=3240052 RepID=UPI003D9431BD
MITRRIGTAISTLAAFAVLASPSVAHAASGDDANIDPNHILVEPRQAHPGQRLAVEVNGAHCKPALAFVTSPIFPKSDLNGERQQGAAIAYPVLTANAVPGVYRVTATCHGKQATTAFTVTVPPSHTISAVADRTSIRR